MKRSAAAWNSSYRSTSSSVPRGAAPAGAAPARRELSLDRLADVLDAAVARQRDRPVAHQLCARVGLGVVRRRAHQPAVELARADEEVEHLGPHLAGVDHARALDEQPLAIARRELGRGQAHVAPQPDPQLLHPFPRQARQHARKRAPDQLGDVAVDLLAVQTADVVGLEDLGRGQTCHPAANPMRPRPAGARSAGVGEQPIRTLPDMSGHSKWASIKHKKAVVDSRRGQQFTKLARAITVAARDGGGDPAANAPLENAIRKAKEASMPKENIERAIAKGTGEGGEAAAIESVLYEGYGPGGVALLIEALTDNRNRTSADIRHAFSKNGGNLGEPGSVAYLFEKKGAIVIDATRYSEDDLMVAVEAGAEDISTDDDVFEVVAEPTEFAACSRRWKPRGGDRQRRARLPALEPRAGRRAPGDIADAPDRVLEELDDVDAVHANFDVPAEVLQRVAGC